MDVVIQNVDLNLIRNVGRKFQECPVCGKPIGVVAGSKEAICKNCGYKDPCCE